MPFLTDSLLLFACAAHGGLGAAGLAREAEMTVAVCREDHCKAIDLIITTAKGLAVYNVGVHYNEDERTYVDIGDHGNWASRRV